MRKLICDRINAAQKGPRKSEKGSAPVLTPSNIQTMPRLELVRNTFISKNQTRGSHNDPDKENKNLTNILDNKKAKNDKPPSITYSLKGKGVPSGPTTGPQKTETKPPQEKPRLSSEIKISCPSPHFNGDWMNPQSSRNVHAEPKKTMPVIQEADVRIDSDEEGGERSENNKETTNQDTSQDNVGTVSNQKDREKPFEGLTIRRSMSLEDLRQSKKALETEYNKSIYQEEPRDYTFSFNNRKSIAAENPLQEPSSFTANFDTHANYFEKENDPFTQNTKQRESVVNGEMMEDRYQDMLRQLEGAFQEIGSLKEQVEKLKIKKNNLLSTNGLLLKELNGSKMREQSYKEKMQGMHAQMVCFKQEAKHYKMKLRETQRLLKQEKISNESNLLFLKEMLSNNISLALEHKLNYDLEEEKERDQRQPHTLKQFFEINPSESKAATRRHPQKYLYSHEEKVEASSNLGRYTDLEHRRLVEASETVKKESQSPWVSLRDMSPEIDDLDKELMEKLISRKMEPRDMEVNLEEDEEEEEDGEEEDQERVDLSTDQVGDGEEDEEQAYVSSKVDRKIDKQIQWLQKQLRNLLKDDKSSKRGDPKERSISHRGYLRPSADKYDYRQKTRNLVRYEEGDRKQSNTFIGVPRQDDINNYSFSLHNSE